MPRWVPGERIVTQAFIGELANVAETTASAHLTPLIDGLRRPPCIAVTGRPGVGRGCVATALRRRGAVVTGSGRDGRPDVEVLVAAETLAEEDVVAVRARPRPTVIVLTKSDLAGAHPGGPVALAEARAVVLEGRTGVPTVPVVGLLAALEGTTLDADLLTALRTFVTEPPNLSSVDAFVDDPHPVDRAVRARLLGRLDRFGIAHAVLALADGCEVDALPVRLARLGKLDGVMTALDVAAAPVRHRRIHQAVAELRCLAMRLDDERLLTATASDGAVLATMTAAVDVVEAAGLTVDRGDSPAAHLARAVHWRRYGRGPVSALHRQCSADIVRGSLRLLAGVAG